MRILFFTPYAEKNGAERMLWYLFKYINTTYFTCAVYCGHQGPLIQELPAHVKYYLPAKSRRVSLKRKIWQKFLRKAHTKQLTQLEQIQEEFKPDIWYVNTIHMSWVADEAVRLKVPYVVHFHDMLYLYQFISYNALKNMTAYATLLIGCAQCVCDKLKIMGGQTIALQYECTELKNLHSDADQYKNLRRQLGISEKTFVWIMPGAIDYRKGIDIIPQLATMLGEQATIICLGDKKTGYGYYLEKELEYLHIKNVIISGFRDEDYYDYLGLANGFVLTSREDPFPLAMIESAYTGKPIVAFNSGGVKEFIQEGMGVVVESWNTEDLAAAMQKIMHQEINLDPSISIKRAKEFDAKTQVAQWEKMIKQNIVFAM